ncbi:MAG TPA: hypothetical protein VIP05_14000 [Burkholderiaceae bacterium]
MPITPFHFGPGAAIHASAPRHVSFIAFLVVNVGMDVEPLVGMLTGAPRLHGAVHTYIGATLAAGLVIALFLLARRWGRGGRLPDPFEWQSLGVGAVALGALAGAWSHIVLDSVMHADITPWAPFSNANALFRIVSLETLHASCVVAGVLGLAILGLRHVLSGRGRRGG